MITTLEIDSKGKFTKKTYDSGQYRELLTRKYGNVVTYGGSYERWRSARKAIMALAKATGISFDEIVRDIQQNYAIIEDD